MFVVCPVALYFLQQVDHGLFYCVFESKVKLSIVDKVRDLVEI
jgi:hypothetical protein